MNPPTERPDYRELALTTVEENMPSIEHMPGAWNLSLGFSPTHIRV
jgi:hypothetical protein